MLFRSIDRSNTTQNCKSIKTFKSRYYSADWNCDFYMQRVCVCMYGLETVSITDDNSNREEYMFIDVCIFIIFIIIIN